MNQDSEKLTVSIIFMLAYSAIAACLVALVAILASELLATELNRNRILSVALMTGAFLASCGFVVVVYSVTRKCYQLANFAVLSLGLLLASSALIVKQTELVGIAVPAMIAASYVLFAGLMFGMRQKIVSLGALMAFTTAAALLADIPALLSRGSGTTVSQQFAQSAYYDLGLKAFNSIVPKSNRGGAIDMWSGGIILGTGNGRLYAIDFPGSGKAVEALPLPVRVPLNTNEFREDAGHVADVLKFRVNDILVREQTGDGLIELFASHHAWNRPEQCFTLRLSRTSLRVDGDTLQVVGDGSWQTLFDSSPCLSLKERGHAFGGHQAGGRMALYGRDQILMTVGDHTFDGNGSPQILPQDPDADYGKVILINTVTAEADIFSLGHRNPQGLFVGADGEIWSTEHGPQGGDELNRIREGLNYGWPFAIYGTAYGKKEWPLSEEQGEHSGFELPVYAWLPSIGISSLLRVQGSLFERWQGDLLVASLMEKTLFRIRIRDNRVVYVEPIHIGSRIRDLVQAQDGSVLMWTDNSSIISMSPANQSDTGQLLFSQCIGCHQIADGATHGNGPDLKSIVGKRIASVPGFDYSNALSGIDGNWSRATLDSFLADPQLFAPGTSMIYPGMNDPQDRAKLIDFLESGR